MLASIKKEAKLTASIIEKEQWELENFIKAQFELLNVPQTTLIEYNVLPRLTLADLSKPDSDELRLEKLEIEIQITGNYGDNFLHYIKNSIENFYEEKGFLLSRNDIQVPYANITINIIPPVLNKFETWASWLAFSLMILGGMILLKSTWDRYLFKKHLLQKITKKKNTSFHEPKIGIWDESELQEDLLRELILKGIPADPLATAYAFKIAEICDLPTPKIKSKTYMEKVAKELQDMEVKLNSISLMDAIKELSRLDKKSQLVTLEHLKITPALMASLLKKSTPNH